MSEVTKRKGVYNVRRVDGNQKEIVECLRKVGMSVLILSSQGHGCPDILVGHAGRNYLFEIKAPGGHLTEDEIEFATGWGGHVALVYSFSDIIELIRESLED